MDTSRNLRAAFAALAIGSVGTFSGGMALAADPQDAAAPAAGDNVTELEGLTVLGSRRYDRSSDTETPVPVDMLPMQKAAEHGNGVTLVLARFDTRWMHDWVLNHPATTALVFVKGRVQFCRPDGSPGPSSPAPSIFIGYGKKASKRLERAVRSGAISGAFFAVDRLALVARNHSVAANDECYRLPLGAG